MSAYRDGQCRYIAMFSDGGSAMRWYDRPLELGGRIRDGGCDYRVVELHPGRTATGLGRVRVDLID